MKKILYVLAFLIFVTSMNFASEYKVIWQADIVQSWEEDWLMELLDGLDLQIIEDYKYEKFIDNSIIVISAVHNTKGVEEYFSKLKSLNYKFGIIHLSDERYTAPTNFYPDAQFVFRNYWHKQFLNQKNVKMFGLGYKTGFWKDCELQPKAAAHRDYSWSFAGQITQKPTRENMIVNMKRVPNHFIYEIFDWNDPNSLQTSVYRDLLLNSIFVPCPTGYWNMDSFRLYESLECGCIPIVENKPIDYFAKFYGKHPFLTVDSWEQAPEIINELLSNPELLEMKRVECYLWWLEYKKQLNSDLTEIIRETLN